MRMNCRANLWGYREKKSEKWCCQFKDGGSWKTSTALRTVKQYSLLKRQSVTALLRQEQNERYR